MTTATLTGATALVLPGVPESVRRARALVRAELGERHPSAEAATACVSELATNAILYTRSGLPGGTFDVTVQAGPGEVLVLVRDSGARTSAAPVRAADEHGRGLCIVEALSGGRWGAEETGRGRVTWCRIPALHVPAQRRRPS
jgi:anti-sigma regulatory factor (Ser/Thr protein kinase)